MKLLIPINQLKFNSIILLIELIISFFIFINKKPIYLYFANFGNIHSSSITFCIVPMILSEKDIVKRPHIVPTYLATFTSWLSTNYNSKILSLIPRNKFDPNDLIVGYIEKVFGKNRLYFIEPENEIETDEDGLPFIDDWFIKGYDYVKQNNLSDMICYINSDIIIPKYWYEQTNFLYSYFKDSIPYLLLTRRCNINFNFNFSNSYDLINFFHNYSYENYISKKDLYSIGGIDLFLFPINSFSYFNIDDIPPFLMSKYKWDPWIVGWLFKQIYLIFLGSNFCVFHINHKFIPNDITLDLKIKFNSILSETSSIPHKHLDSCHFQIINNSLYFNKKIVDINFPDYFYYKNYP